MKKIFALAILAAASVTASAATNLFTDGSFESISQATGSWNTYNAVPGWTVTQASFATTVGQTYEISFWYQNRAGVDASSEGFDAVVLSGGVSSASLVGNAASNGWLQEKIIFTAGSNISTFSVAGTGTSDGYGTSLDNFSAIAVPEPATMGLFAAGLAILGLSARRRRK